MRKLLFIFFSIFFCIQYVRAQVPISVSLEEAKEYAIKNAYEIKNAEYDVLAAKKKVWETIAIGLPQINAEANYTDALDIATQLLPDFITPAIYDVNEDKFGLTPLVPRGETEYFPAQFGQQFSGNYSVTVSQLLFDGSYIVGIQAVKVYLQLAEELKEKTIIEIKDIVSSAYYGIIVAKENLGILKAELESNEKLLNEVQKLYENGFREETDVLQIQLLRNNSKNKILDAERTLNSSKNLLKYVMGIDIDNEIEVTDNLHSLINESYIKEPVINDSTFVSHIDIKYQKTNLKAQKYLLKSMYSKYLPTISAFYSYRKDAYNQEWNIFEDEWYKSSIVGLKISIPIFKSGLQSAKIKQQKFTLNKLENNLQQMAQKITKDNKDAYDNLTTARNKYENNKEGLILAKTILDRTTIMFNEGIANSAELTQREGQYLQSLNVYIYATLNLLNAKKTYLKSIGKL